MIKYLKEIFGVSSEEKQEDVSAFKLKTSDEKKLRIATCALFVELAKSDSSFNDEERSHIIDVMKNTFNLEDEYVNELIELSERKLKDSVSLYEFTTVINEKFNRDEKFELLLNLWRLIYIDEKLDKYEDHLIKVIGGMLNVEHKEIITAKMMVKEEQGRNKE